MENLTKQQIVLLTLLVSFVTSIATGIVTVSLMDQAPKAVTQTINRVVERTVERVAPASNSAAVATKETIVVKADDLVVAAVEKNRKNVFRIMKVRDYYGEKKEFFGGLVIPVSKKGIVAGNISILSKELDSFGSIIPESYVLVLSDGKTHPVVPVGVDEANSLAFFGVRNAEGKPDSSVIFTPVVFGNSNGLKLGQTVIALGGAEDDAISTGIISALVGATGEIKSISEFSVIKTDIRSSDDVSGTILMNLSGEIVGMQAGRTSGKGAYLPSNIISAGVSKVEISNSSNVSY